MSSTPLPLRKLIEHFASLPGIGSKSAQRLAFHILSLPTEQVTDFAKTLTEAKTAIHNCRICQNFTDKEICDICASPERDASLICVVEIMLARNICYSELSETEREEVVNAARKIHSSVNLFNGKNIFEAAVNNEPYSKWAALMR